MSIQRSFCPLPEELRAAFEPLKTTGVYRKGDTAFRESDPCHSVFVVCTGSVKLFTAAAQGRVLLLRFARPGDLLGIAEAVTARPYDCSAIAAEPSVLACIPHDTFMRLAATYPAVACRLTVALSEQYRLAQREAKFLAFGETSTARLRGCCSPGRPSEAIPSRRTSRAELAESIGSTRETVTRILAHQSRHRRAHPRLDRDPP
jgi:CRP/FNR family transcriptional regulator